MLATRIRGGGATVVIAITNRNITHTTGGALGASAGYRLDSDASVYAVYPLSATVLEQWCSVPGRVADYEAKVTTTLGTLSSGTTGTWQALSTDRLWKVDASAGGYKECTLTVEIRRAGVATILSSASIFLAADAT